ncbi:unnamed protein product [Closterium sp. Naga37s-1]|nr:unnamed protein product [Closterium sp. Naga37s-1]
MAVERAKAVTSLADIVKDVWKGLEETIIGHIGAAQTNIVAAVTRNIVLPPPPPPPPQTQTIPEELLKSFKADVLKAVTEATQQSFLASGLKIMSEVVGTVAPARRGSSPSANGAGQAQGKEALKQGQKRGAGGGGGDGGDSTSVKRSKGAGGSRVAGEGSKGAGEDGLAKQSKSVVDILKKHWATVGSPGTGHGGGSADGGPAAQDPGPTASPLVADKEIPTTQTAVDGGARTVKGPSVGVAGTTSTPRKPPAASSAPVGPSATNNDGPATLAPAGPSAAKGDAKDAAAKVPAAANALREMLHRLEAHRKDVQQPPLADAALAETTRRSVTPQVDATVSNAPPTAPLVAARPPADPKSALLRARLGARANAAAHTPGAAVVDAAAEKGTSAALATGGGAIDPAQATKGHNDADIAAIQDLLEAAKRLGHPPALAISDTAHVESSASPAGGSAEPKTTTDAVDEGKSNREGKADTGRASFQRKTRATSATKVMSAETGQENAKAKEILEKSVGKGTSAKKGKEKAAEKEKEKEEETEKEEKEKEKGRKGHGIRQDKSGDGLGWVGEIKVVGINRYIGKSREKLELAYLHSIAYIVYDGYVSKVLLAELTGLDETELEKWRKVWEEVKILPTGMWTVIWARGAYLPKTLSGDAHHDALFPAIWFPVDADTKEGKEKSDAMMSAMIDRVSKCAAYGKVVASATRKEGDTDEMTAMATQAWSASACAVWCLVENEAAQVVDAVGEGKAAAMVVGASDTTAGVFKKVMQAVLEAEIDRDQPLGEVAHNVAPALQSLALQRVYPGMDVEVEADVIARATVETMAFSGMCPVAGPKLEEIGISVPCDAQMEWDIEHRGRKGQRGKQGKDSTGKNKGKVGRKGKDSTAA